MTWHRPVRIAVGIVACASAVTAYVTSARRPASPPPPRVERLDPEASLESQAAVLQRVRESQETFKVRADRTLTYKDGSTRQYGVQVAVRNRDGRDFNVTAQEARATNEGKDLELSGAVKLAASDGFELAVEQATYAQEMGVVNAAGDVSFLKGRLSGASKGMSYDTNGEILNLLANPDVHLAPDTEGGAEGMAFRAGTAMLDRVQHVLSLDREASVSKGAQVLSGDMVLARLSEDEQRVTFVELHGRARVTGSEGTFQELTARDMELAYAEDGVTLERAVLRGEAVVVMPAQGDDRRQRRFSAGVLDLAFDEDGKVTRAEGSEGARVEIPGTEGGRTQTVTAAALTAQGGEGGALSDLRFSNNVVYQEKGQTGAARTAKASTLQLRVTDAGVQAAVFGGGATFEESGLSGAAQDIEYDVRRGQLVLSAAAAGVARLQDERLSLTAPRVEVGLEGRDVQARGGVKTELRPVAAGEKGRRMPGLFAQERSVNANADRVSSAGEGGRMSYSGDAMLWQGDTAVRAGTIELDREGGNLVATDGARLSLPLNDGLATGRAARLQYQDELRRLTLDTPVAVPAARGGPPAPPAPAVPVPVPVPQSYLSGPQGEIRADRIAIDLAARSSVTEQMEANGTVTLRLGAKRASSQRLRYLAKDESYELIGTVRAPVSVIEACRATTGRTLIFYGSTDRILVDGSEEVRTQTKGGGACPPSAR